MEPTAVIYRIILLGHLASAIIGFGGLFAQGAFHAQAVRNPVGAARPILAATSGTARVAEYGIYATLAFGIVLISLSDDRYGYGEIWVSASFLVWFAIVGLIHGVIRPARKRLTELTTTPAATIPAAPAADDIPLGDAEDAKPLLARLAAGEAGTQLLLVISLVMMIWKPGH